MTTQARGQSKRSLSTPGRGTAQLAVWLIRLAVVGAFIGLWQLAVSEKWVEPLFVGTPGAVLREFVKQFSTDTVTIHLGTTVYETLVGFIIAVVSGFVAGVILSRIALLRMAMTPLITAANSLPRIALAPLFAIWFGLGPEAKIALVVSFVFFVMLTTTVAAFTQPNADSDLLSATLGTSAWQHVVFFQLPAAIPTLFAGLELSLIYSYLGAVSGEILAGQSGLGVLLTIYANAFEIDKFLAVLLLLVIVSTLSVQLIRLLTAPLTRWHRMESATAGDS